MEKKKGEAPEKSGQKRKKKEIKRPQTQTQDQSDPPETKEIGEKSNLQKLKPVRKKRQVGNTTNEEATPTKSPLETRPEAPDGKPAKGRIEVEPTKPGKRPDGVADEGSTDVQKIGKKHQKKPGGVSESAAKKKTTKIVGSGQPVSTDDGGTISDAKKSNVTRPTKEKTKKGATKPTATKTIRGEDDKILRSESVYRDLAGPSDEGEPKQETPKYSPETLTGFTELPLKKLFVIFILWLPRFFVPWMIDWHEYNVFILINPDLFDDHTEYLFKHDMILLAAKITLSIFCSIIADFANMRYYVYLALLFLYLFCPISGGIVDMVLRSRTYDQHYYKNWIWCIIMMRWALAIPYIMTPVQLACVFLEKNDMSRKAHYNWTGIFLFFEFANAFASFWLIPAKCPTKDWIQIAVWVGIGMLMFIVIFFTLNIFLLIEETRETFRTCLKICGNSKQIQASPSQNKITPATTTAIGGGKACMKLILFVLMLTPLIYMSFVFATLDRFLPDDDWDKHKSLSATSMFVLGKVVGVVVMVVAVFIIRKFGKLSRLGKMGKFVQKIARFKFFSMDVMVLGFPHLLNILALFVLLGRFEALTKGYAIEKGHVHYGPIPDDTKTVVLFFNLMLSNRTVCVGSEHFPSVKIRPFRHTAVEVFDPGVNSINITITPEPGSTPVVATHFTMTDFKKGRWVAYTISIFNDANTFVKHKTGPKNYYAKPRVVRLEDSLVNVVIIPNNFPLLVTPNNYNGINGQYKYWVKYEGQDGLYSLGMWEQSRPNLIRLPMNPYIWKFVGCCNYTISISDPDSQGPDDSVPRYTFRVNSIHRWPIYYLVSYLHSPIDPNKKYKASELPVWFKLFLVAETARWTNQAHLPDKSEMQRDWAIKLGLSMAGMAAGGVSVGVLYVFWMDLPYPKFPATTMAVFWAFWAGAAEPARLKLIDIDPPTETVVMTLPAKLLTAHIPFTVLHFVGAIFFYHAKFNFRNRPD